MRNIYAMLEVIKQKPALFLGNLYGITALDHFIRGFQYGGGHFYDRKLNSPDFSLFTVWLGGTLKYKYENSSENWRGLLLAKYKVEKKALEKFFFYLEQFKTSKYEVTVIKLAKTGIEYAIKNEMNYLWCGEGFTKSYYKRVEKIERIILFKLKPSRSLFSLLLDKNDKIIDDRNTDMTDKVLRKNIQKQFGINLSSWKNKNTYEARKLLQQHKII